MEARWLVEEAAPGAWPVVLEEVATPRAEAWFTGLVARRAAGEPLQYVLGHWAFRTLDLMVDARVLIPRPETEVVVEVALEVLDSVDLGTGSGAIALSLAVERHGVEVWATDDSPDALAVAGANLAGLGGRAAPQVRLVEGSWWDALPAELLGRVTLAVANPPYIASREMDGLDPTVRDWEPRGALEAGTSGLEDIRAVLAGASSWLVPGGGLVVEIAPHQAGEAARLAGDGGLVAVEVRNDLAGRPRALVGRAPRH
jgi:release factor glutamine methyltransferase